MTGAETPDTAPAGSVDDRILSVIVREGMVEREKLLPEATLEDLGVESVEVVMILNGLEEEFDIYIPVDEAMSEVRTVGDMLKVIKSIIEGGGDGMVPA